MSTAPMNVQSAQDINAAVHAHMAWKRRIREVIDGSSTESLSPENLAMDNQCVLGKWIYEQGAKVFGNEPEYQQLRAVHAHFHVCAAAALTQAQEGLRRQALENIETGDMAAVSRDTVNCLTQMYQKARQASKA